MEGSCSRRRTRTCGALSLSWPDARSAPAVTARYPGGKLHGTSPTPRGDHHDPFVELFRDLIRGPQPGYSPVPSASGRRQLMARTASFQGWTPKQLAALRARSSSSVEIIRHTVWGYFSQRTGLLIQLEDSHLLRIKSAGEESVYWETTMESCIEDYRPIDGIYIAHAGRTTASLFRFGDSNGGHARTRIEEIGFDIRGLSMDCFVPPGALGLEQEKKGCDAMMKNTRPPNRAQALLKIGHSKVAAALDTENRDSTWEEDGRS